MVLLACSILKNQNKTKTQKQNRWVAARGGAGGGAGRRTREEVKVFKKVVTSG